VLLGTVFFGSRASALNQFIRGDADQSGRIEVTDAVRIFRYLFAGAGGMGCLDAADVDDDGRIGVSDGIQLLNFLFQSRGPPRRPFPACGTESQGFDNLTCERFAPCAEAPPATFHFYGQEIVPGGLFFVMDSSGTMLNSGELQVAKREVVRLLCDSPPTTQFGIIFFSSWIAKFPVDGPPAAATPENQEAAAAFVAAMPGGSGTCPQRGLLAAIDFTRASTAERNVILFIGDGGGTCGGDEQAYLTQTLEVVTRENDGRAAINTIGVIVDNDTSDDFLRELAARNGGVYRRVR
jgi:hypothetical protein